MRRRQRYPFGPLVRQKRKAMGMHINDLAQKAGMSGQYLQQIENGYVIGPSIKLTTKIADIVDLDLDLCLALIGYIPDDIEAAIIDDPLFMCKIIRQIALTPKDEREAKYKIKRGGLDESENGE